MTSNQQPATSNSLSRYWLLLGTAALAMAGLLSLVLVVARTPQLAQMAWFDAAFHKALVVHVDLSVLVWFLAIACLLWSRMCEGPRQKLPLEQAALISFALGTLLLTLSPLDSGAIPLMSNYIPVITSPLFFLGLGLLLCGVGLMLVKVASDKCQVTSKEEGFLLATCHLPLATSLRFGLFTAGLIALMAAMAFIWSHYQMPAVIDGQQYYDMLFWGGGHVLQFLHAQILLVVWILLMRAICDHFHLPPKFLYALFSIGLIAALATPIAYVKYNVASMEHREFFTQLMIGGNGIAPLLLALALMPGLWNSRSARGGENKALWSCLVMSVLLFLYGGILGGMIQGQNVVIPAHYHGSIVGITLAFMGAAYLLLPQFGYRDMAGSRLAFWQPIVYGGGQLMHITGLAVSGGYGVLRKTPGGLDNLAPTVKAAMGFMGLGGLLAIIGGLMFVVVIAKAMRSNS